MPDIFQSQKSKTLQDEQNTQITTNAEKADATVDAQTSTQLKSAKTLLTMPPNHPRLSSFFTSLFQKPDGVSFINQEPNEDVILLLHASFVTNIPWIFFTLIFLLLPPIIFLFFPTIGIDITALFTPSSLVIVFFSYYLIVFGYAYVNYIIWFYNVSIVSNLHVLDIELSNISFKKVDTVTIIEIADVSYNQAGFIQTFFDYGTVRVDPQAQNNSIFLENVPRPSYVTDLILDLREAKTT